MEGPCMCIGCQVHTQELVTGLPSPEHVAAIERRRRREWIAVVELEGHADREANARIAQGWGGNRASDSRTLRPCAAQVEQRQPVVLPRRHRRHFQWVR